MREEIWATIFASYAVAIEVISDDRHSQLIEKLAEYEKWGVRHIWVIDPDRRSFAIYEAGALRARTQLTLRGLSD